MKYEVKFNDKYVDLPKFSYDIAEKIKSIQETKGLKAQCEAIYDFLKGLVGQDKLKEKFGFGDFDDCDPNELKIVYFRVKAVYEDPAIEDSFEEIKNKVTKMGLVDLADVIDKVSGVQNFAE